MEPGKTATEGRLFERLCPNPKARRREQFHEVCRFKRMAERTEEAYGGLHAALGKALEEALTSPVPNLMSTTSGVSATLRAMRLATAAPAGF